MSDTHTAAAAPAPAPSGGPELAELVEQIDAVVFALEETIDVAKALSVRLAAHRDAVTKAPV